MSVEQSWRTFLEGQGAVFENGQVADFGNPAAERLAAADSDVLVDLSGSAFIRATGAEAETFLHNQLSNDLKNLAPDRTQLSAYCNPKGRMLALFRILREGDGFLLQLPAERLDPVLKRLRMYVLRAQVTLEDAANDTVSLGIAGPNAPSLVAPLVDAVPTDPDQCSRADDLTVVRLAGPQPRFQVIARPSRLPAVWTQLSKNARAVGEDRWTWFDIHAGLPVVYNATAEEFVPQMANVDAVDGINFKKGCYPGQEVVARMHYLGRLKQRMMLAHVETQLEPTPGMAVFAPGFGEQAAGKVVSAAPAPGEGWDLLAVVQTESSEKDVLHLGSADGPALDLQPLPYTLPAATRAERG